MFEGIIRPTEIPYKRYSYCGNLFDMKIYACLLLKTLLVDSILSNFKLVSLEGGWMDGLHFYVLFHNGQVIMKGCVQWKCL